ncbi:MAG TPA: DUF3109 family protein [Flavobacteriales bacterium]|nr:DUF3109 family protein [Flavobacteriales bacterium]
MFQVGKTIITDDLFEKEFVCNLNTCKGICCVEGDSGAPLLEEEKAILEQIFPIVKAYLTPQGIEAIEKHGKYVIDKDGDLTTPLINERECAYVTQTEDGTYLCGIEKAYHDKKIDWPKPISCHLYPIRVKDYPEFQAVNYNQWDICEPACELGKQLQVPLYKFLKEPLIRKFGEDWYKEIEIIDREYFQKK